MRLVSAERIMLLALATVSVGWGQVPTITSLQSSRINSEAQDVTGVTSGTASLGNGFVLYINGTFHPGSILNVKWLNTSTNVTTIFDSASIQSGTTQISLIVPFALFSTPVPNPVPVTVTVTEAGGTSSAPFTINPPLQAIGPILVAGTLNQPYNASLITGGTPPFDPTVPTTGTLPAGLNPQLDGTLIGFPKQTGVFNFQNSITDIWGNTVKGDDTIEIVDVPTVTSLSPNSSGSGAGTLTITVNGTNFVAPVAVGAQQIPGSQVKWFGQVATSLVTTFVNSNQLTAVVPAALLATPGAAAVAVVQPSNVSSIVGPGSAFIVNPPSLSSISPVSVPAGSGATALSVLGANFVVNAASQAQSTVTLTGTAVATTFVNTGALTAAVPASMLNSPAQFSVQVTNPGGAISNPVTFSVLAPVITSLSPLSVPAGSPAFQLTATGTSFLPGSQISFFGTLLPATLVNGTLTATVPANLVTSPAQIIVRVINPGGTGSNAVLFNVSAPGLTSISPNSMPVGSPDFQIVAVGASFLSGSQILFNGTALPTSFLSSTSLSATVPASLIASTGQFDVRVQSPGGSTTLPQKFSVVGPAITSITPVSVPAGAATFTLTVNGNNFAPGARVLFDGTALATTASDGPSPLLATVPASLIAGPKVASIVVANPGVSGNLSNSATFTVIGSLSIITTFLPSGTVGIRYTFTFAGRGGTPPYSWSASGFPSGLSITPTGVLSGTPQTSGSFLVSVVLQDAAKATASAQFQLAVAPPPPPPPPPVTIASNSDVPAGTVGVAYIGYVFANGGSGTYTFSLTSGSLPDGLTLSTGGAISGTPRTAAKFSFSVTATDSAGASGTGNFTILIQPAPLVVTGAPPTSVATGTLISVTFGATGGVPPYHFTPGGTVPPGTSFTGTVLSGTTTTAGSFTFNLTVVDSAGVVVTKPFTVGVTEAVLSLSGALKDGKVGVLYSGQLTAAGGTPPYIISGSGLPDGLSLSSSGAISGTPTTAGKVSITATVTDSKGGTANGSFPITIVPADLIIVTGSLPDGVVGAAYSASLTASGGIPPYTWTVSGLPDGVSATPAGGISGTPNTAGKFTVSVTVTDGTPGGVSPSKSYFVTIAPPALVITTASLPNGTVGTAYTASISASGGTPPLTFSATGLPAGLTMSADGKISGTPTTPGAATIVVTVKDAAGATTSKSYPVTISLPPTPPLNFTGVSPTAPPLTQPRLQVSLGSTYPVDVVVTLTLTFAPDSGPDDPTIQFSTGGRTTKITIPAGSTNGSTDVGVQTGSVAGLITITSQLQAAGQDITPSPAPRTTIRIAALAPVITAVTAVRNGTGFTVTITGYVTDREMTQAAFTFTAAAGSNLQTTTLTVPLDALFAPYFGGASAIPFGGQFIFTQPFTVTGSTQAIASVTVTLSNKIGQSAPATATLN